MVHADDARISDETLIGRVAAGDFSAFERLVKRHQAAVFRFAQAAAPAAGEPEEILRETFLAARSVAARHRHEPSPRPWLLALARQAIDRRHPGRAADPMPFRELAQAAAQPENLSGEGASIAASLASLPAEDREVLTLCDRERLTVDEAALVTGLENAAVR